MRRRIGAALLLWSSVASAKPAPMAEPVDLPPLPGSSAEIHAQFKQHEGRRPRMAMTLPGWNAANLESLPPAPWRTVHQDITAWLDAAAATFSASIVVTVRAADPDLDKLTFVVEAGEDIQAYRFGKPVESSVTPISDDLATVTIALPEPLAMGEDATLTVTRARPLACDGTGFLGFHMCGISTTMSWLQQGVLLRSAEASHDPSTIDLHVRTPAKFAAAAQGVPKGVDTLPTGELMWHFHVSQPTDGLGFAVGDYKPMDFAGIPAKGTTPALPPVRVNMRGYNVGNVDTIAEMTRHITGYFGVWFCPFPWQQLQMTMLADNFGGGLSQQSGIFASGNLFAATPDDWQWLGQVELQAHEIAHQWWGNYVQPLQYGDVSLSESLAEFSAGIYTEQEMQTRHLELSDNLEYVFRVPTKSDAALGSAAVYNSPSYVDIVYHKGAVVFHMLRRQIGEQAMKDVLHAWTAKYGNDFATVTNFRQVTEKTTGQNLTWFFKQWFEKKGKIQAEVSSRVLEDGGKWLVRFRFHQLDAALLKRFKLNVNLFPVGGGDPAPFTVEVAEQDQVVEVAAPFRPGRVRVDWDRQLLRQFATGTAGDTTLDGLVDGADFVDTALRVGRGVVFTGKNGKQYFYADIGFNELFDLNADLRVTAKDLDAVEGALGSASDEF